MQWENLTSPDFEKAIEESQGVGIIPVGVLEAHGAHLPLGTDMFAVHWTACRAAEEEPAIVLLQYPFGIVHEAAHLPGALVIRRELVFALLENICDEMARHGLTKIILLNGHGGNRFLLPLFVQTLSESEKAYTVYHADPPFFAGAEGLIETKEFGHACEGETSVGLHLHDHLVKMDQVPPEPFTNLNRNKALSEVGAYSPADWYAMYPSMYVGDATKAHASKGKAMAEHRVAAVVKIIRAVKDDSVAPALQREFLARMKKPSSPYSRKQRK